MVQRVTYRRRLSYNTSSNQVRKVKTPGGKLVLQYVKKRGTLPKCPMTGQRLRGIKKVNNQAKSRIARRHKTVTRAYGGVLAHNAVRDKIIRAFLIEEQKIVRKMLIAKGKKE